MIPQVVAKYTSSLSTGISKTSTSMTLSSTITRKGETVPTGFYGFVIDRGQENEEVCTGTYNEGVVTFVLRGLSDLDGSTSVEDNKFAHDKGAIVEITAHPALSVMLKTFDTFIDTYQGHWEGAVPTYADLPTGTNDGEARITLDDSKLYIWDATDEEWKLAGAGGGAGTVYRTTLLGTESTGDDNKTFTLTSGSFPDKKYFQVYKNGVLMGEGATNDYVATGSNQAVFNEAVLDDDVIDLLVISVDLYNPAWGLVDSDILPDITETHDIGSTTKKFKDAHYSGNIDAATFSGDGSNLDDGANGKLTSGTAANELVRLDGDAKLPAVDGSQLTNLQTFPVFQSIPYYAGSGTTQRINRVTSSSDGSTLFIARLEAAGITLIRLEKNSVGQYWIAHTRDAQLGACPEKFSLAVVGSYLYLSTYGLSSDSKVFRYSATDLSGKQEMTISGTKFGSTGGDASFGDGNNLYVYKSENVFSKYSVSGTTITFVADITYTSAGRIDNGGCASDNSYVWMAAETRMSIIIKKYDFTGGAALATSSTRYLVNGNNAQDRTRLFIGKSGIIGVSYGYQNDSLSAVVGASINLNYFPAP